jgi:arylsulfatase B
LLTPRLSTTVHPPYRCVPASRTILDYTHDTKGAYDFNDDTAPASLRPAIEFNDTYSTYTFTQRAVDIISTFSTASEQKMFLYLPYQNVHWPLEAPQSYVDEFSKIPGILDSRAHVCAMAKVMDDGIANVTAALKRAGIFDDTLVIFSSDSEWVLSSLWSRCAARLVGIYS